MISLKSSQVLLPVYVCTQHSVYMCGVGASTLVEWSLDILDIWFLFYMIFAENKQKGWEHIQIYNVMSRDLHILRNE